jgi:CopG family nickel-responsive transcriptional regulator
MRMHLKRFGVSIPEELLSQFDDIVREKGYIGRSEAIRDAMRMYIDKHLEETEERGEFASLNIVYHHKPSLMTTLLKLQHDSEAEVISTVHTHITKKYCFEILTIRGTDDGITRLANKIEGLSGIEYSKLFKFSLNDDAYEHHTHSH